MAHPTLEAPVKYLADGGAPVREDDHSLAGFELARRLGADGWEVSGHLSSDQVVVLDRSGKVGWRRRSIGESPAATSGAVPLADLFAIHSPTHLLVSIGVADRATLDAVVLAATGAGALQRTLVRCSGLEILQTAVRDHGTIRPMLGHEAPLSAMPDGPERHAARLRETGIDTQVMNFGQWTGGLVAMFHRFGRTCAGRGAVHVRMIREFVDMGLDMVSSAHPDRLDEVRSSLPTPN